MKQRRFFVSSSSLFWINLAFWLALSVLEFIQIIFYAMREEQMDKITERGFWIMADFLTMWLLSFGIYYLFLKTHKWPFKKMLWIHAPASLIYGFINLSISMAMGILLVRLVREPEFGYWEALGKNIRNYLAFTVRGSMIYWVVILILYAIDFYSRYKRQQLANAQLETKLAQSELQTLKMQLHPHFLFNALNSISMLVRRKKEQEAVEMLSGLGDMLRKTLSLENSQFSSLNEELELLKKYLDLEQIRFRDKLSINYQIDPNTLELAFPSLLLQPILENAFKHGISHTLEDASINIQSELIEDSLKICVFNNGPLLEEDWKLEDQTGIGLNNTISRLAQLYGDQYHWEMANEEDDTGVKVCFTIPASHFNKRTPSSLPLT